MSETHTATPAPASGPRHHTTEVLLNLIITLLTPMFFASAGGDLALARLAAAETLAAYRAETHADLITVAKIIAFGLATLASLSLSMADDLPIAQILRLQASANATDRSEHRNRLALKQSRAQQATELAPSEPEPEIDEAALTAAAAAMQQRTAEHLAQFTAPAASPEPAPAITDAERQYAATWAASAAQIAAETAASLPTLPPEERRSAAIWIEVLNASAKEFMAGNIGPRPRPGDLAAIMRPPAR
jgi:hypothetical protein